jgi:hypothetical protein
VWHEFVEVFKEMNDSARIKKRSIPSKKQIELLENLVKNMTVKEREKVLNGKKPEEFTGEEMRETLDRVIAEGGDFPASEKQIGLVIKLADQLGHSLKDVAKLGEIDDINNLTGGKDGSASRLIDILIKQSQALPATEAQVKLVKKIVVREEVPLTDILSIADIVTIEEMTKQDASKIIDAIVKKNKSSKKKK